MMELDSSKVKHTAEYRRQKKKKSQHIFVSVGVVLAVEANVFCSVQIYCPNILESFSHSFLWFLNFPSLLGAGGKWIGNEALGLSLAAELHYWLHMPCCFFRNKFLQNYWGGSLNVYRNVSIQTLSL